jgi:hypothetical protein
MQWCRRLLPVRVPIEREVKQCQIATAKAPGVEERGASHQSLPFVAPALRDAMPMVADEKAQSTSILVENQNKIDATDDPARLVVLQVASTVYV